jgi:hypothetical protein
MLQVTARRALRAIGPGFRLNRGKTLRKFVSTALAASMVLAGGACRCRKANDRSSAKKAQDRRRRNPGLHKAARHVAIMEPETKWWSELGVSSRRSSSSL